MRCLAILVLLLLIAIAAAFALWFGYMWLQQDNGGSGGDNDGGNTYAVLPSSIDGYRSLEASTLTGGLKYVGEIAAALTAQPELTVVVEATGRAIQCFQSTGAVNARVFFKESDPLVLGGIAVADPGRVTDAAALAACYVGAPQPGPGEVDPRSLLITTCHNSFTASVDGQDYIIGYVGTNQEACNAFCSALPGCSAP